ncbi:hypothetical protein [Arthrobacter sp. FW306-06-A]|uniref:hypothetical protein n=1 Tax=Arthrobacter sp. FW306-06-A TaxID=2879621 RepID=UPI001F480567|nr:hypothetical protein [Arthrobacter sp. FW306-06-A]UKA73458.1 hypothetical protein LFT49_21915 [Arthrobacter sp. FW306-06-A]
MRLVTTDVIAGLPAPAAREFLRRIRFADFDEEWALFLLSSLGASGPHSTLLGFEDAGYIERAEYSHGSQRWWRSTTLGNALAMASFGKPITRKTADRLVAELIERAKAYNADPTKPCFVQRLRIFGSYLDTAVDPLGDVDVELVLGQRTTDPQEILRYGTASGRSFSTFTDHLLWPGREAVLILKNRSTAINITLEDIDELTDKAKIIYSMATDETCPPPPPS